MSDTVADGPKGMSVCAALGGEAGRRGPSLGLTAKIFFEDPTMVGSAFPASGWLVRRMLEPIDWKGIKLFVEFGPGTGAFTRVALSRLPADAALLALDTSPAFVDHLRMSIGDPRLHVVCAPASNVAAILRKRGLPPADCVLSGLPFSTLDPAEADRTMRAGRAILAPDGMFCAYQMFRAIEPLLKTHIGTIHSAYEWRNVPPCHLYWAQVDSENAAPTETALHPNISTETQLQRAARRPGYTLDHQPVFRPVNGSAVSVDYTPHTMTPRGEENDAPAWRETIEGEKP
jgi:phospholipid N-methyltransferase